MRWAEITVRVPPDASEAVAQALMDNGCTGVAETASGSNATVTSGWLPVDDLLETRLTRIRERFDRFGEFGLSAPFDMTVRRIADPDWLSEWRKHHKARSFGRRLLVCPSWEESASGTDRAVVLLDPGMAFGTGGHPTTILCLEALDELVRPGMLVADVGTGSGILAIAAVKLGAAHVYASEIDALPRRIAAENAQRNGVADRVTILTPEELDALRPTCDLVVCNIIAETIVELAPLLSALVAPDNGALIASGIVEERYGLVEQALIQNGFEIAEVRADDVWRAIIARRSPVR